MSDVAEWFYARGSQQMGPVTLEALRLLAVEGKLTPADLVWKNGTPDWKPAGEERELFEPDDGQPDPNAAAPTAPVAAPAPAPIAAAPIAAASVTPVPIAASTIASAPLAAAQAVAAPIAAALSAVATATAPVALAGGAALMSASSSSGAGYAGPHLDPTWNDRNDASESEMPIPTHLARALFCMVFGLMCGLVGLPFAIVGMFFAAQVGGKLAKGDLDGAQIASDRARTWCRLSFWLAFAALVAYLYLFFTGAAVPGRTFANTAIGR